MTLCDTPIKRQYLNIIRYNCNLPFKIFTIRYWRNVFLELQTTLSISQRVTYYYVVEELAQLITMYKVPSM